MCFSNVRIIVAGTFVAAEHPVSLVTPQQFVCGNCLLFMCAAVSAGLDTLWCKVDMSWKWRSLCMNDLTMRMQISTPKMTCEKLAWLKRFVISILAVMTLVWTSPRKSETVRIEPVQCIKSICAIVWHHTLQGQEHAFASCHLMMRCLSQLASVSVHDLPSLGKTRQNLTVSSPAPAWQQLVAWGYCYSHQCSHR